VGSTYAKDGPAPPDDIEHTKYAAEISVPWRGYDTRWEQSANQNAESGQKYKSNDVAPGRCNER